MLSEKEKGSIAWTGEVLEVPKKNTKLPKLPGQQIIQGYDGKTYRVGASVKIQFDEDLKTRA